VTLAAGTRTPIPLTRSALSRRDGFPLGATPVRIVHIGLGAFHRAHQAWYTSAASDSEEWGIAAFTGRSATAAEELTPQDGLYTLIERSDAGDSVSVIPSIVEAVDGARLNRFVELIASPEVALVTLTITEPGYRLTRDGQPDVADPAVAADIEWLAAAFASSDLPDLDADGPRTALGRLLLGLDARRRSGAGPIAIVPCDNIPDNGPFVRVGLLALAEAVSAGGSAWLAANVSFVSTSVDRITPKSTEEDIRTVTELSGWIDRSPVVTEPFRDWILSGEFPAGRPAWETAGARFVDDIEPFERRKLWLLNGAHSLLAYAGRLRGHATVAAAIADPICREWVNELWDGAARQLPDGLELDVYRQALLTRFENSRIEHGLSQIGREGLAKLRVRILPVAHAERAAGRDAVACVRVIAAWIALLLAGTDLPDAQAAAVQAARAGSEAGAPERLLSLLDGNLASDAEFLSSVESAVASFR
jgi:fructuronate reductase